MTKTLSTLHLSLRLSVLAVIFLAVACNPTTSQSGTDTSKTTHKPGYEIEVFVEGFSDTVAYLANHMGNKQYMADTTSVKNGKFVFKGDESLKGGIYMVALPPDNRYFELVVADDQYFKLETKDQKYIEAMKVTGSLENEVFYESLTMINEKGTALDALKKQIDAIAKDSTLDKATADEKRKPLTDRVKELTDELNDERMRIVDAHPDLFYTKLVYAMKDPEIPDNPDPSDSLYQFRYMQKHYLDDVDFSDPRLLRTPVLHNKVLFYIDRLSYLHPDSLAKTAVYLIDKARADDDVFQYVAITLLNKFAKSKIMGQDGVYVKIVENVYSSGDAFWADEEQKNKIIARAQALAPTMLGGIAPNMTMADMNGQQVNMHQVQAAYTILYFWDYDCGHCKKVTPALGKLYKKYKNDDISMYAVSINGDIGVWKERVATYELDAPRAYNVSDHGRTTGFDSFYDLQSTPRIFLLDKDKRIVAKQISVEQLEEMLDRLLKEESGV